MLYGVGINDADYCVQPTVNGKQVICPFYRVWVNMLKRCYNEKYQAKRPTYIGCAVCDEWLTFSKFKSWMETQSWQDKHLDKDLLVIENKTYAPDTCIFVDRAVNNFTLDSGATRGNWPLGVRFHKPNKKFVAQCRNPFTKKPEHLGCFDCPDRAHEAWRKRKHEHACQLADLQQDPRVAKVLRERYAPDKDWTNK